MKRFAITLLVLGQGALIGFCVSTWLNQPEIRYVYLQAPDGPDVYPEMPRVLSREPSLGVDAAAGEDSHSPFFPASSEESSPAVSAPKFTFCKVQFSNDTVKEFVKKNVNGPYCRIPKDAAQKDLDYFEIQAEVIIKDWEAERDRLFEEFGGPDSLITWEGQPEPEAVQLHRLNDRDRQAKLKALVLSLWPDCWTKP